ncbi:helix-turn-helix domain-containing protein [Nocardioides sp. dk4132]|uniref:helix-turn-helix domain-containing protein n=1 Tax=unclassified Nocardioides TaxID=2615069 RepID=UPI001294BB4E|nr:MULTISPECIES: helix-turn-helix domain-containing protein [unclassified Nocardioides]MQW75336.1 helix-turn-helix domain-containing protein [Nocardioides sp. dk4132]QGA07518.1 helix-turn-helix domain-containing protein [Nocardioides sp. dk884]
MGRPVHPALTPYVASLTAYDVDLGAPGVHRGLPGTTLTLVLPVGEPLDVGWAGSTASRARRWSTVSGLHAQPAQIHHDGHQAGVQLALTTAGARALLGVPAAALAGTLAELEDVVPELRHLPERLAAARPAERAAVVEGALLARLYRPVDPPRPEVGRALAALTRGLRVEEAAAEVGYSRRHLATLVRAECGLTPRDVRRLARFERARAGLGRAPLAEVAHRCGYADQAHLTREWVALAGCPPTTWLREEFPFLQDQGAGDGTG